MLNLYFKGDIGNYLDPIDLEVEPDVKRRIRADLTDIALSLIMSPEEGNMVGIESFGGKPAGNVFSTDKRVTGSLNLLIRTADGEKDLGTVLLLPGRMSIPTMGMDQQAREWVVDFMIMTLQVQQWMELNGILDKDPNKDPENLRILVDIVDDQPVAKILGADEEVYLDLISD